MRVYAWPSTAYATNMLYGDPTRTRVPEQWDGAPGQRVEHVQRVVLSVEGEIWPDVAPDFDILMDRISGGLALVAFVDYAQRSQFGWDLDPALNSGGSEFWRANGNTSSYASEAANPPTGPWRSIYALAAGATGAGALTLAVDGLLDSEVIPKGAWIRIGDHRHRVAAAATANASGEATLSLARPLRSTVADNANIKIPGDLFVGALGKREISPIDSRGIRTYQMEFIEVYEDEIIGSPSFEWQI